MREWIDQLVSGRYKTVSALAKSIGMTESGFSRAMKAGTFEIENCLRLADETGESPTTVLRMAGKTLINDLIEKLYGVARQKKDPDAAKAYELMEGIDDRVARESFLQLMRGYQTQAKKFVPGPGTHKAKQSSR